MTETPTRRRHWPLIAGAGAAATVLALALTPAGAATDPTAAPAPTVTAPDGSRWEITTDNTGKLGTKQISGPTPTATATATATPTATPGTITSVTYSSQWQSGNNGDRYTVVNGATATVRFTGTTITLRGITDAHHVNARVTIDGQDAGTTTSRSATRSNVPVTIYTRTGLAGGEHTLTLTAVGTVSFSAATTGAEGTATGSPTTTTPTATTPPPTSTGFVTQRGTGLYLDGKPYRWVGMNTVNMQGCTNGQRGITDYESYYRNVGAGMTDRLWVLPGASLANTDRIVAAAKANNARIIITLFDGLGCIGPRFDGIAGGWDSQYRAHVANVVNRYKDNTTIAGWEVANEGSINNLATYRLVSDYIRSLDKNHIIATGNNSFYSDSQISTYRAILDLPNINLGSAHEYDTRVEGVTPHLARNLTAARQAKGGAGVPVYIGEGGIDANTTGGGAGQTGGANGCVSFDERARLIAVKTNAYLNTPGVVGYNYWSVGKDNITGCDSYMSLTEEKGLNAMKAASARWSTNG